MRAGLPVMKNVLMRLAKNVLLPFGLSAGKKIKKSWIRNYSISNFKGRNGRYNENSLIRLKN